MVLQTLVESGDLSYQESLRCVEFQTACRILSGQDGVLNIDRMKCYTHLSTRHFSHCMQVLPNSSIGLLATARIPMQTFPRTDLLLDNASQGSGVFLPELEEPEHRTVGATHTSETLPSRCAKLCSTSACWGFLGRLCSPQARAELKIYS